MAIGGTIYRMVLGFNLAETPIEGRREEITVLRLKMAGGYEEGERTIENL